MTLYTSLTTLTLSRTFLTWRFVHRIYFFFFFFFKERLGLKLTHKRITTKVVLPASKGKGAIQGEVKMCKEGESYDDKLLKSPKVRRYRVRNQRK